MRYANESAMYGKLFKAPCPVCHRMIGVSATTDPQGTRHAHLLYHGGRYRRCAGSHAYVGSEDAGYLRKPHPDIRAQMKIALNSIYGQQFDGPWLPTVPGTYLQISVDYGKGKRMATVNICDRCEALFKEDIMSTIAIDDQPTNNYNDPEEREICAQCRKEFDEWWTGGEKRSGQAVTEKYQKSAPPEMDDKTRQMARMVAEEYVKAQAEAQKRMISDAPSE